MRASRRAVTGEGVVVADMMVPRDEYIIIIRLPAVHMEASRPNALGCPQLRRACGKPKVLQVPKVLRLRVNSCLMPLKRGTHHTLPTRSGWWPAPRECVCLHKKQGCRANNSTARLAAEVIPHRSEEQTSELQSLMRISCAVFCLKNKQ